MYQGNRIAAIIPALDEELAIQQVVNGFFGLHMDGRRVVDELVVCDNGSKDCTADLAYAAGARVVREERRGYGAACLAGLRALRKKPDIVLFVDGDQSAVPEQAFRLLDEMAVGADLVIGTRALGIIEPGAMSWPQRVGNWLFTWLIRRLWKVPVSDLGPYRAIRYPALQALAMADQSYGWTVEMQIKAIQQDLTMIEVPVDTLKRIGRSKVSGTARGVIGAAFGILRKIVSLWCRATVPSSSNAIKRTL